MTEKIRSFKGKVKQKGIFNYKDLYEFLFDFFMENGYDVHETKYREKINGDAKEVEISWDGIKDTGSNYFKYQIAVYWIILGMKPVTIKKDGREIKSDSGTVEISFTGNLIKDPDNKWDKPILRVLRDLYDRYIIKQRIENHEIQLYQDANEVVAQLKSFLAIEGQHEF